MRMGFAGKEGSAPHQWFCLTSVAAVLEADVVDDNEKGEDADAALSASEEDADSDATDTDEERKAKLAKKAKKKKDKYAGRVCFNPERLKKQKVCVFHKCV